MMDHMLTSEYDGCGRCLVGVLRLSRKTDSTFSPERQRGQILAAAADVGAHIVAWAEDLEVSGATDPMTRPKLGPWLRGEMGPYDGIAAASVDRVGRNVRDTLNTQDMLTKAGRIIVTADHRGVWDFSDPADENEWMIKAWASQMELRAIQKRNVDDTASARATGRPKQKPSYGYHFIRLFPTSSVDHVEIDQVAAQVIQNVAERILADETGKITCSTEAARLNRAGVPSPSDRRAQIYGRPLKGHLWTPKTLRVILTSEAALGLLMHQGKPVTGQDGRPVRLADPLWDRPTRDALIEKTNPKRTGGDRAPMGVRRLSGVGWCGNCGIRLYIAGRTRELAYGCTGRVRGVPASANCEPAPSMAISLLDQAAEDWFLGRYGSGQVMRKMFDPGTGYAARIKELKADRKRLRDDRARGMYNDEDDAQWYQDTYAAIGAEIQELKQRPERPAGMRMMPTGRTVAQEWHAAPDDAARRELLNEFGVRVVLFPETAPQRYVITAGLNPYAQAA